MKKIKIISLTLILIGCGIIGDDSDDGGFEAIDIGAQFRISENLIVVGDTVYFENNTDEGETFLWDFGDGSTSSEISPTHQYNERGRFKVLLTAMKDGLSDTSSNFVEVFDFVHISLEQSIQKDFGDPGEVLGPVVVKVANLSGIGVSGILVNFGIPEDVDADYGTISENQVLTDDQGLAKASWTLGSHYDIQRIYVSIDPIDELNQDFYFLTDSSLTNFEFESQLRFFMSAQINDEEVLYDNSTQDVSELIFRAFQDELTSQITISASFPCPEIPTYNAITWTFESMDVGCDQYSLVEGEYTFVDDDPDACAFNQVIEGLRSTVSLRTDCMVSTGSRPPGPEGSVIITKVHSRYLEGTFVYRDIQCVGNFAGQTCLEDQITYELNNGTFRIPFCDDWFGNCY